MHRRTSMPRSPSVLCRQSSMRWHSSLSPRRWAGRLPTGPRLAVVGRKSVVLLQERGRAGALQRQFVCDEAEVRQAGEGTRLRWLCLAQAALTSWARHYTAQRRRRRWGPPGCSGLAGQHNGCALARPARTVALLAEVGARAADALWHSDGADPSGGHAGPASLIGCCKVHRDPLFKLNSWSRLRATLPKWRSTDQAGGIAVRLAAPAGMRPAPPRAALRRRAATPRGQLVGELPSPWHEAPAPGGVASANSQRQPAAAQRAPGGAEQRRAQGSADPRPSRCRTGMCMPDLSATLRADRAPWAAAATTCSRPTKEPARTGNGAADQP